MAYPVHGITNAPPSEPQAAATVDQPRVTAATRTFAIPELLENILTYLITPNNGVVAIESYSTDVALFPCRDLFILQRVDRTFQTTIATSPILRQYMWLEKLPGLTQNNIQADDKDEVQDSFTTRQLLEHLWDVRAHGGLATKRFKRLAYSAVSWLSWSNKTTTAFNLYRCYDADSDLLHMFPGLKNCDIIVACNNGTKDRAIEQGTVAASFFRKEASWRKMKAFRAAEKRQMLVTTNVSIHIDHFWCHRDWKYSVCNQFNEHATLGDLWDARSKLVQLSFRDHLEALRFHLGVRGAYRDLAQLERLEAWACKRGWVRDANNGTEGSKRTHDDSCDTITL